MSAGSQGEFSPEAQDVFASYLARLEGGEQIDFESLCQEHATIAEELRRLHEEWQRVDAILQRLGRSGSLSDRIQSRYGSGVDPTIALEDEEEPSGDFTSEIVQRLAGRGETYGRYKLKGEVARGGQGAILRVWDESSKLKRTASERSAEPRPDRSCALACQAIAATIRPKPARE